jgi:GNAT superfamily N-acetyltransferase
VGAALGAVSVEVRPYVHTRAHVEALGTADAFQRQGLATLLVEAVEEWARGRGAVSIGTTTYADSPLSVPFWEERMQFRRRGITLVKQL